MSGKVFPLQYYASQTILLLRLLRLIAVHQLQGRQGLIQGRSTFNDVRGNFTFIQQNIFCANDLKMQLR